MLICRFRQITASPKEEGVGSAWIVVGAGDGKTIVPVGGGEQAARINRAMLKVIEIILIRNIRTPF